MLVGCGGSSSGSSSDIGGSAFDLPSQGIGVDSSDPVGIWVGVGSMKGSSVVENAENGFYYEEDDLINKNTIFDVEQKIYFAIGRNEDGQLEVPCGGDEFTVTGNQLISNYSTTSTSNDTREDEQESNIIEILDNGRMTWNTILSFNARGVGELTTGFKDVFERETKITAVKISDSTSFHDLYEFSFRTTDGVNSFTDDAGAGDKGLLCAEVYTGTAQGTFDEIRFADSFEGVDLEYKSKVLYLQRTKGMKNTVWQDAYLGDWGDEVIVNCDETNCGPIFDVQASKDALILSSTNENIITKLTIKTSK
jgi:hypothetical protein